MVEMILMHMSLTPKTLVRIAGRYQVLFSQQMKMAVYLDMNEDIFAELLQLQAVNFSVRALFFVLTFC